jgi:hypothetical protein
LISKTNFDDPRSARFQRLSASIGRFSEFACQHIARLRAKKTVSADSTVQTLQPPRRKLLQLPLTLGRCKLVGGGLLRTRRSR